MPKVEVVNESAIPVSGLTVTIPLFIVPGIGSGAAYASGDAMGTLFTINTGCTTGMIQTLLVIDQDKEQLAFDVVLFKELFTPTADNSAFDAVDAELRDHFVGIIPVTASDYAAFNDNAAACVRNVGLSFTAPGRKLYGQLVTRGAPNYTAATDLSLGFSILADK